MALSCIVRYSSLPRTISARHISFIRLGFRRCPIIMLRRMCLAATIRHTDTSIVLIWAAEEIWTANAAWRTNSRWYAILQAVWSPIFNACSACFVQTSIFAWHIHLVSAANNCSIRTIWTYPRGMKIQWLWGYEKKMLIRLHSLYLTQSLVFWSRA